MLFKTSCKENRVKNYKSPFFVDTDDENSRFNRKRYAYTLSFIKDLGGVVLDCGESNKLKHLMEKKFNIKINSTKGDLDFVTIDGKYDFILAFEMVEHLMNPLWLLCQINSALKPNGILYLSTPINKPKLLWRPDHFHEFDEYRLKQLFQKANFEVIRYERKRFGNLLGIRPIIRFIFRAVTLFVTLRPV